MGQLRIEGGHIERLTLTRRAENPDAPEEEELVTLENPGSTISLPVGVYDLRGILVGDGNKQFGSLPAVPRYFDVVAHQMAHSNEGVLVTPHKPAVLKVGAPLSPRINVRRYGRTFLFTYQLFDAEGNQYPWNPLPVVTIFSGGRKVGAGSVEYG